MDLALIAKNFAPTLILALGGMIVLFASILKSEHRLSISAYLAVSFFIAGISGFWQQFLIKQSLVLYGLVADPYSNLLCILLCFIGAVISLFTLNYFKRIVEAPGEIFALMLFAIFGMCIMLQTTNLLTLIIGLEVMSLSVYVLVGVRRSHLFSLEASLKYFVLGSVASSFILLGMAFFYGGTGSLELSDLPKMLIAGSTAGFLKLGVILIMLGFAFKVAAVPFHFWAPDVYEGAPYPIVGFMASSVKVAAFGAWLRILPFFPAEYGAMLTKLLLGLSLATIIIGTVAALGQESVKRILAYSSISHAGYLLLGLVAYQKNLVVIKQFNMLSNADASSVVYYLVTYTLMTLGTFAVLSVLSRENEEAFFVRDFAGLAKRKPLEALSLAIFLFSLAGIPPAVGFFGKFYLFKYAFEMGLIKPVLLALVASAVSFYYYMAPVAAMYFKKGDQNTISWATPMGLLLILLIASLVIYVGINPANYLFLTQMALMK